jgi:hypothetical protein
MNHLNHHESLQHSAYSQAFDQGNCNCVRQNKPLDRLQQTWKELVWQHEDQNGCLKTNP